MTTILEKFSSRKFIVLVLAMGLHLIHPAYFTGDHMVIVFALFIFGNAGEHVVDLIRAVKGGGSPLFASRPPESSKPIKEFQGFDPVKEGGN